MRKTYPVVAFTVIAVWALFAASIVLLDWKGASALYNATNAVGLLGFVVAVVWFFLGGRWTYVCLLFSGLVLFLYAAQWVVQLVDIYRAIPDGGIGAALYRLVETWGILFRWRSEKFGVGWALVGIYWDVVIVPLQFAVIALLYRVKTGIFRTKSVAEGDSA